LQKARGAKTPQQFVDFLLAAKKKVVLVWLEGAEARKRIEQGSGCYLPRHPFFNYSG